MIKAIACTAAVCLGFGMINSGTPAATASERPNLHRTGVVIVDRIGDIDRPPAVQAASYVVADLDTGEILAAKNARQHRRPASTLKTLTALTLLPKLRPDARYRATRADEIVEGTSVGLRRGFAYTHEQLFHALMLPSANDAANALARSNGGIKKTIREMNNTARELGAMDTVAATPSGLEPDGPEIQHTSAYDLALIARAGMRRDDFRRIVGKRRYSFPSGRGGTYSIHTTNRLFGKLSGTIGIKTGYTSKAKNTYVGAAQRNGRRVVVTAMRMDSPSDQVASLLRWGFRAQGKVRPVGRLTSLPEIKALAAPALEARLWK